MTTSPAPHQSNDVGQGVGMFLVGAVASFAVVMFMGAIVLGVSLGGASEADKAEAASSGAQAATGEAIYSKACASCHGATGLGGVGPRLALTVADRYPNIADQIAIVTEGRKVMPAFGGTLTAEEIEAVVIYEREELGQ